MRSFWTTPRKRPWTTLKGPWRSLTNLVSTTAWLRAQQRHHQQERRVKPLLKLQSAKRETCPARYAISKHLRTTMGVCTGRKRPRSRSRSRSLWRGIWRRLGELCRARALKMTVSVGPHAAPYHCCDASCFKYGVTSPIAWAGNAPIFSNPDVTERGYVISF